MICVKLRSVNLTEHIPLCYGSIEKNNIYIFFRIQSLNSPAAVTNKTSHVVKRFVVDLLKNMKETKFLV